MTEATGSKGRVLVVEDDGDLRIAVAEYFTNLGFEVVEAQNVPEACGYLTPGKAAFEAVVTDLALPGAGALGGFVVVEAARSAFPRSRIVLMTGLEVADVNEWALARGVDVVLGKPASLRAVADAALAKPPSSI